MSTRNIILIIFGAVAALGLLVLLFVGSIVGFVFYTIGQSEPAQVAKTFLRNSENLKREIGDVEDFGTFATGHVNTNSADGQATLNLKVIGSRKTINSTVMLAYGGGSAWRVTGAVARDANGRTILLLDSYERDGAESNADNNPPLFAGTSDESFEADVLSSPLPVLVKFTTYAVSEPADFQFGFEKVATRYAGTVRFYEFYVDQNPDTARTYRVKKMPTLILFDRGAERGRVAGLADAESIARMLERGLAGQ